MQHTKTDNMLSKGGALFLMGVVLSLDWAGDGVARVLLGNAYWYGVGFSLALLGMFVVARMPRNAVVTCLLDLYLYALLAQIFGWGMYVLKLNPPSPTPLPYHVLIFALALAKILCVAWSSLGGRAWPVIGPFSYVHRHQHPGSGRGVIYLVLLALLPLAYLSFVIGGGRPLDLRAVIALIWFALNWDFLMQLRKVEQTAQTGGDEKVELTAHLRESGSKPETAMALDEREQQLLQMFRHSTPESQHFALKTLGMSSQREMAKAEQAQPVQQAEPVPANVFVLNKLVAKKNAEYAGTR